jgi:hypothetical protein
MGKEKKAEDGRNRKSEHKGGPNANRSGLLVTTSAFTVFTTLSIIVSGFFGHFYDPLVEFGLIPIGVICCAIGAYELPRWRNLRWQPSLGLSLFVLVVLTVGWRWLYWRFPEPLPPSEKSFSARAVLKIVPEGNGRFSPYRFIYAMYGFPGGAAAPDPTNRAYQVSAGLYLQLTNTGSQSFMVDDYFLEFKSGDGNWNRTDKVITGGNLFMVKNPKRAYTVPYGGDDELTTNLKRKNISAGDTVQGWVFIDILKPGPISGLRIRICDASGWKSDYKPVEILASGEEMGIQQPMDRFWQPFAIPPKNLFDVSGIRTENAPGSDTQQSY